MSRDYKSPPPKPVPSGNGSSKFLVGVVIGLFLGLGIALAVALFIQKSPSPFIDPAKSSDKEKLAKNGKEEPKQPPSAGQPEKTDAKQNEKPRFDFYKILPGVEEPVTEQEIKQAAEKTVGAPGEVYFLQAGSFQAAADADNLKAKLTLLDLPTSIQTADLQDKGVWHRVRVGPFKTLDEINRARATLGQNNVQSSLVKIRDNAIGR